MLEDPYMTLDWIETFLNALTSKQRDYTEGKLDELINIIVYSGARLFVSAVGVAPIDVVEKLHAHGIFYMNLVGHPKHVAKGCATGADIICAQGSEAGGHTGEIPTRCVYHPRHLRFFQEPHHQGRGGRPGGK